MLFASNLTRVCDVFNIKCQPISQDGRLALQGRRKTPMRAGLGEPAGKLTRRFRGASATPCSQHGASGACRGWPASVTDSTCQCEALCKPSVHTPLSREMGSVSTCRLCRANMFAIANANHHGIGENKACKYSRIGGSPYLHMGIDGSHDAGFPCLSVLRLKRHKRVGES